MKQIIRLIITVALAFTVSNISLLSQFGGGDGTATSPYEIHNKAHLEALSDSIIYSPSNNNTKDYNWSRDKHFKVMNDITDTVRTVIGSESNYFQGNFDGNGFKIVLGIDVPSSGVGLFVFIGTKVNINNIIISNLITEGYVKGGSYLVGSIVGYATRVTIKNCINNCDVTAISSDMGQQVGGIAGFVTYCNIENCINNGKIFALSRDAGGIVGHESDSKITNCTNTGEISSKDEVGGIAGCSFGTIENCMNSGRISGDNCVGGISGWSLLDSKIINCINIGTVKGNSVVGGISSSIEWGFNAKISNCVNSGLIIGNDRVGGILGYIEAGTISNCINTGTVKGNTKVGCIVGEKTGGTVINCHYDKQMCSGE